MANPITPNTPIINNSTVLGEQSINKENAILGASPNSAPANNAVKTLLTYDSTFTDFFDLLADAYYPGSKQVPIKDLGSLVKELSKYSTIETLVICTESMRGALLLNGASPTTSNISTELGKSKVKVTGKIVFEGCRIMVDPVGTCKMVKNIVTPATKAVGVSYFCITQPQPFDFRGVTDKSVIEEAYKKFDDKYWLKKLPAAKEAVNRYFIWGRRWFRESYDKKPPEEVQRGILSYEMLQKVTVSNLAQAKQLMQKYEAPVTPGELVTVTNIAEVAKG